MLKQKGLAILYFVVSLLVLTIYGSKVCPYIDSLEFFTVFRIFGVAFLVAIFLKILFENKVVERSKKLYRPTYQMYFDLVLYLVIGSCITIYNFFALDFPIGSGVKVMMGCMTVGAFASLDNALYKERLLFQSHSESEESESIFPMTRRLSLVFAFMGILTVIVVALVVVNDVDFMLKNRQDYDIKTLQRIVFTDIGFVIGVLLVLSLRLIHSFSKNLNYLLSIQIEILDYVACGELDAEVPLVTRDEFRVIALKTNAMIAGLKQARKKEETLMQMIQDVSSELELKPLLNKIVSVVSEFLEADRSSIFLYDKKNHQLWSMAAESLASYEIRINADEGLAGYAFSSGETIRIKNAYEDHRFSIKTDIETGYKTRSVLCMQIHDKNNQAIGVIEAVNKKKGSFSVADERRLQAFCSQVAITLVNAQLYDDVMNMKNYNESVLKSLSNGVITMDDHHQIVKINASGKHIMAVSENLIGSPVTNYFYTANDWLKNSLDQIHQNKQAVSLLDVDIPVSETKMVSANLTLVPLMELDDEVIGSMLVIDDITQEKRVQSLMSKYLPPVLVDKLIENPDKLLEGVIQPVTVMFSDIRQFTSLSEKLGARKTVAFLNEYFSIMVDKIENNQGILNQYTGDGFMSIFGAPFSGKQDADNAVQCAIEMMRQLTQFNQQQVLNQSEPINIGIGISTGDVILGNVGSLKRMEYTAVGDSVNLAARLESATKQYGVQIMICEKTMQQLSQDFQIRYLDCVRVKGQNKPVTIYEVLGFYSSSDIPDKLKVIELFEKAVDSYKNKQWEEAISGFGDVLALKPEDKPSEIYLQRCQGFIASPPDTDWDGIWSLTEK